MRKQAFFFLLLIIYCMSSCLQKKKEEAPMSKIGLMLQGEHKLRKLTESAGSSIYKDGSFFITSVQLNPGLIVGFAWEKDSNNYILSTLPFNKIRIKFVDKIDTPTIKFRWRANCCNSTPDDINEIMRQNIIYAVISIQKEDWPEDIQIPMNRKMNNPE